MDVTGTWKGEYAYDENPEAPRMAGHVVAFTMSLKLGWLGMVSGTVQDDARSGFTEAGTIRGKYKGRTLQFTKQMPVFRLAHELAMLSLEKWVERHKVVMDTERAHPPIRHLGEMSEDGQSLSGTWLMGEVTLEIPGSHQVLKIPELRGTWTAKRVNEEK